MRVVCRDYRGAVSSAYTRPLRACDNALVSAWQPACRCACGRARSSAWYRAVLNAEIKAWHGACDNALPTRGVSRVAGRGIAR